MDEPARPRHMAPVPSAAASAGPTAEELLVRVAKGDERAFELLYDQLAGPILGLVRRIVRDAAQSEEVAQEVLVELWRTATRYAPVRQPTGPAWTSSPSRQEHENLSLTVMT